MERETIQFYVKPKRLPQSHKEKALDQILCSSIRSLLLKHKVNLQIKLQKRIFQAKALNHCFQKLLQGISL